MRIKRFLCALALASLAMILPASLRAQSNTLCPTGTWPYPNDPTTGTTQFTLTKINSSGKAVIMATTDTNGFAGIAIQNAGQIGSVCLARVGIWPLKLSNTGTVQDYVQISSATGGDGVDTGASTFPTSGGDVIGRVQSFASGAGLAMVDLGPEVEGVPTSSGLADPGANGIVKRTALNTTAIANATDLQAPRIATTTGSANAYVLTLNPAISSYTNLCTEFISNFANTGAATININGGGAVNITKNGASATALVANDIKSGQDVSICYDGTVMEMMSQTGNASSGGLSSAPAEYNSSSLPSTLAWNNPNLGQYVDPFSPYVTWPNTRVTRTVYAIASGAWNQAGDLASEAGGGCSSGGTNPATASASLSCEDPTGATIDTPAGVTGDSSSTIVGNGALHRTGRTHGMMNQTAGSLTTISNVRMFRGMTNLTIAGQVQPGGGVGSDVPTGQYVGFMFSTTGTYTGLTDTTHFICVVMNGTTQNAVSSGVSADTNFHYFALWEDVTNSKWHFYIDNAEVCGTGISTDIPASGTNLAYSEAVMNLTAANVGLNTAWVVTQDDK